MESHELHPIEYGKKTSQLKIMGNNDARLWMISRFIDLSGNYIDYEYQKIDGQILISDILYTSHCDNRDCNDQQNESEPYNTIHFEYEDRPDIISKFVDGGQVKMTKRLKKILLFSDNSDFIQYYMNYKQSSITNRSLLTDITQCRNNHCFPETSFEWTDKDGEISWAEGIILPNSGSNHPYFVDLNNDGLIDFINVEDQEAYVQTELNQWERKSIYDPPEGKVYSHPDDTLTKNLNNDNSVGLYIDYNGDGKTDYIYYNKIMMSFVKIDSSISIPGGTYITYHYENDMEEQSTFGAYYQTKDGFIKDNYFSNTLQEIKKDILYENWYFSFIDNNNISYYYSSVDEFINQDPYCIQKLFDNHFSDIKLARNSEVYLKTYLVRPSLINNLHDINGDGQQDILYNYDDNVLIKRCGCKAYTSGSTGLKGSYVPGLGVDRYNPITKPFGYNYSEEKIIDNGVRYIDINGDGLDDYVVNNSSLNAVYLNINYGWSETQDERYSLKFKRKNGNYKTYPFLVNGSIDNGVRIIDINGDGLRDLIASKNTEDNGQFENDSKQINLNNIVFLNTVKGWQLNDSLSLPIPLVEEDGSKNGILIDINNDKLIDYIVFASNTNQHLTYINTNDNWLLKSNINYDFKLKNDNNNIITQFYDINGDEFIDAIENNNNKNRYFLNKGEPDLINKITEGKKNDKSQGYDRNIHFYYSSITDKNVYSNNCKSDYSNDCKSFHPYNLYQEPFYVVSKLSLDTGVTGDNNTEFKNIILYKYGNRKVDLLRRSSLGFGYVEEVNIPRKQITVKRYKQYFPFTGYIEERTVNYYQNMLDTGEVKPDDTPILLYQYNIAYERQLTEIINNVTGKKYKYYFPDWKTTETITNDL